MNRMLGRIVGAGVALGLVLAATEAGAYEHQWHFGANVGYAVLSGTPTAHGYGGGLHLTYGLTDVFNALAQVEVTLHPSADAVVGNAGLGVAYVFDILEWVPYVGLMAGPYELWSTADACGSSAGPPCSDLRFGLSVPVGLDYQISSSFAVGAHARYHMLVGGDTSQAIITAFARAEYIWGF